MLKQDFEFAAEDGTLLRGHVHLPDDGAASRPTILLTHGFTAWVSMLEPVVNAFVAEGFGVLAYDHRNHGLSDGTPRIDVDPVAQYRDLVVAISAVATVPGLDAERIGLWGTSFAGAHVLAAGTDPRVKAVVSQIPFIAGADTIKEHGGAPALAVMTKMVRDDRAATLGGAEPGRVPLTCRLADRPEGFVMFPDDDTYDYMVDGPYGSPEGWENSFTIASLGRMIDYDVRPFISRISPTPLMILAAPHDTSTPSRLILEAYQSALEPKELVLLEGSHHDFYPGRPASESATAEALRWFKTHL
ncbi:alpha/beta fold hydrolase [Streptomyces sp. NPDC093085]|uniref:alpha/beta hydrolase n=1 Tax=Streptomyces sp. NPDC093085 TaxID=3155068 RepID=UPI003417ED4A